MRAFHFDPARTWKLYHDSGIEIDIWKDAFSDQTAAHAQSAAFRGKTLRITEVHDLIAMKLRANRPQDDYDISEILETTAVEDEAVGQRVAAGGYQRYQQIKQRCIGS